MPKTFKLGEPLPAESCPRPFGVGGNGVPVFECLRLLSGAVDLTNKNIGSEVKLRYCHLTQAKKRVSSRTIDRIVDTVFDGDLLTDDVRQFLIKAGGENKRFWEELRNELCFCLHANKKGKSVEAFLHLYRILELVSVAVPLIYANKISDFREALKFIKSLNKNDRDQDLAILKYFVEAISKGGALSSLSVDFSFENLAQPARTALASQLGSYVFADGKISHSFFETPEDGVSVEFKSVSSFMVSCRNRLFHNAITNDNFKLDPLYGASSVCSVLIGPGLYWFSIVLSEILKAQAARYV